MNSVSLREAKARLSALVQAAEQGKETVLTKHGRPAAKIVPIEGGVDKQDKPSFAQLLMSIPHDLPIRRNRSRARSVKF
jgi:prevent-host-death family protein